MKQKNPECTSENQSCCGSYLFLMVLDGQFELGQVVTLSGVQLFALVVVSVVQDRFQLSRTPRLVQEIFGESLTLLRQLLVLLTKLVLHL